MSTGRLRHQLVWLAGYARLRLTAGRRAFELPPQGLAAADHLTTVVRVPDDVAAALGAAQERLRRLDPRHHYYPPQTMHLTVANLDHMPAGVSDRIGPVLEGLRPVDVLVRGLGVSPTTVFARVLPKDSGMRELRNRLAELAPKPLRPSLGDRAMLHLSFVNVVRFRGPVSAALLREVVRLRAAPVGRFSITEVELVRTDRLLSDAGTQLLQRFPLGARSGPA
jgi:2'-5' RNA ligase